MTIAQLEFPGTVPPAHVVAQWLKTVEDEPLWLVRAAFDRRVLKADQNRLWKTSMGMYLGQDEAREAREVLYVGK